MPETLKSVLDLISTFALLGGGLWLLWGAIVFAVGMKGSNGSQQQEGIWQIVGGGMILVAAGLFKTLVV